ncbi:MULTISPECIES: hypothetical protein [Haloarcula]|uniref:hypothetical protein n=1 Tax=Haloarcula TaxID=2237 RepID=UPI0023EE1141|nr:hypothetical protein [Halomicroarcula sp. XH51]
MACLQTRLLGVQLVALATAVVGEVVGSRAVTTVGVVAFSLVLAAALVARASERVAGVLNGGPADPASRRTER